MDFDIEVDKTWASHKFLARKHFVAPSWKTFEVAYFAGLWESTVSHVPCELENQAYDDPTAPRFQSWCYSHCALGVYRSWLLLRYEIEPAGVIVGFAAFQTHPQSRQQTIAFSHASSYLLDDSSSFSV